MPCETMIAGLHRMLTAIVGMEYGRLLSAGSASLGTTCSVQGPRWFQPHRHAWHELAFVDSGTCHFVLNNNAYRVRPGGLLLVAPNEYHYENPIEPEGSYRILWLRFRSPCLLAHISEYSGPDRPLVFKSSVYFWSRSDLESILRTVRSAISSQDRFTEYAVKGYLLTLVSSIATQVALHGVDGDRQKETPFRDDHIVKSAKAFMNKNIGTPGMKVCDVADALGYSNNYFISLFSQATGQTPYRYLMDLRMETARNLLVRTDKTIGEIAEQVGFGTQSHFSYAFKTVNGVSPTEYRRLRSSEFPSHFTDS